MKSGEDAADYSKDYCMWDLRNWWYGGFFYIFGAFIYAKKIPEKHYPKRFDHIGSSHQLFHIFIVIAAFIHLKASYELYIDR